MSMYIMKCINFRIILATLSFFICVSNIRAQHLKVNLKDGQHISFDNPKDVVRMGFFKDRKMKSIPDENPEEVVKIIVIFKQQPLVSYQNINQSLNKASQLSAYTALKKVHSSFRTSLYIIEQQLSSRLGSDYRYTIRRDYYRVLNGVALDCKRRMIDKMQALPLVMHIGLDKEVLINLEESVHQIRADIVQDSLGYTGEDILIGIIDTGIDYNHTALGGGYGPGFRVVGGYDFANNDDDPVDDFDHGTHVAGIIGAKGNDSLRGVAPDVKFLAVKVLDESGRGHVSDIIAGIEFCLDPDNNIATDDAVDIINMSLGLSSSDKVFDNAVDNASDAGVLCVVAAGNDGRSGYGTIGSPATSVTSLTVGACDSNYEMAVFSSQGPDPNNSSIKPDVVAPGVNILSTISDNEFTSMSGTSMAAPHVTGVASLLKQQHPSWSPAELKAAIVNSACSLGENISPFSQGKGIVDALDAASQQLLVEPGIINFGMVDVAANTWIDTVQIKVKNYGTKPQNVQLNILDGVPIGAELIFDITSFILEAMRDTTITAILKVPSSVPVLQTEPFAYLGKIAFVSESDNVVVPFSFIKSTTLIASFDTAPKSLTILDRVSGQTTHIFTEIGKTQYTFSIKPKNPLYVAAEMMRADTLDNQQRNNYFVVHEIDDPSDLTYAFISYREATIPVLDSTIYDYHNTIISTDSSTVTLRCLIPLPHDGGFHFWWLYPWYQNQQLFFSPLNSEIFVQKEKIFARDHECYGLKKYTYGLQNNQDIAFPSGAKNLAYLNFLTAYNNPVNGDTTVFKKNFYLNFSFLAQGWGSSELGIDFPFSSGKIYVNKQDIKNYPFYSSTFLSTCYDSLHTSHSGMPSQPMLRTPDFTINNNNEFIFEKTYLTELSYLSSRPQELTSECVVEVLPQGDTVRIEDNVHITFPNFVTYLEDESLYMTKHDEIVFYNSGNFFRNSDGGTITANGLSEVAFNSSPYWNLPRFSLQTFADNRLQDNIKPYELWDENYPDVPSDYFYAFYVFDNVKEHAGLYKIIGNTYTYQLLGQYGLCTVDYEYQMPAISEWPAASDLLSSNRLFFPSFSLLQVSMGEKAVKTVQPGQHAEIRLVLFDVDSSAKTVSLSLVPASGELIDLPISNVSSHEYRASIPSSIPAGFIDIVATFTDNKGNKGIINASPAFYSGNRTDNIQSHARIHMASYVLNNADSVNFITGDTLDYTFSYVNYGNKNAGNVLVDLPSTQYFSPVGSQLLTIESLQVKDTVHIPVKLAFLGKQQSTDSKIYYSPTVTWDSGETQYKREYSVLVDFKNTVTNLEQNGNNLPDKYALYQNFPNPFNPCTTVKYTLPEKSQVSIRVYNIMGQEVATVVDKVQSAGNYEITWKPSKKNGLPSGVQLLRLQAGEYTKTIKMLFLK